MATRKKGIVDQAMASKPVRATKNLISKAASAAVEAFNNPPLAPDLPRKPPRRAAKKSVVKTASKKTAAKKMDSKLVSTMETYEVQYLARKHGVTQKAVKEAVSRVGHSRTKVEAEIKRGKR